MSTTVTFTGQYAGQDVEPMVLDTSGLTDAQASLSTTQPGYTAPAGAALPYRLVVRDQVTQRFGELVGFAINRVSWELNGYGTAEFTMPVLEPTASLIRVPQREVEIWRGNNILWAGPMVRVETDGKTMTVQCQGLGWYFKRRHVGKADRTNYLGNPEFELSPPGTFPYAWGTGGVTATVVSSPVILGKNAAELYQLGVDVDTHIHRQIWFDTGPDGLFVTIAGHFFITDYQGPAFEERGLYVEVRDNFVGNGTPSTPEGRWTRYEFAKINEETPRNRWMRAEVGIHLPASVSRWSLDVRCYAVTGRIVWDALSVTTMESLASGKNEDQAVFAGRTVQHAQDASLGKSNLGIVTNTTPTGIVRNSIVYQYVDHLPIEDALNEWPKLRDGFEWDIVVTPAARTFTTYYPRKENVRPDVRFELGPSFGEFFGSIVDFAIQVDGEATANEVIVLGEGEGPDREEGAATDVASLGGLTLERVIFPPAGSPINVLDSLASAALERLKRPVTALRITVKNPELIGSLQTGDIVTVVIEHGWVQVNGEYRIIAMELNADDETLALTLNQREAFA